MMKAHLRINSYGSLVYCRRIFRLEDGEKAVSIEKALIDLEGDTLCKECVEKVCQGLQDELPFIRDKEKQKDGGCIVKR